jgi:hypothetical protein
MINDEEIYTTKILVRDLPKFWLEIYQNFSQRFRDLPKFWSEIQRFTKILVRDLPKF